MIKKAGYNISQKLIQELEEFLIPYVMNRYDFENTVMGAIFGKLFKGPMDLQKRFITFLARALIRCILSVNDEMYLNDISTIVMSEAYVMMEFTAIKNIHRPEVENVAGEKIILENEIHAWLLHLQDNEKLPGRYERFIGLYKGTIV